MNLSDYLKKHNITSKQFAKTLGVSQSAVGKWRINKKHYEYRVPKPAMVIKIQKVTKGQVSYADWY